MSRVKTAFVDCSECGTVYMTIVRDTDKAICPECGTVNEVIMEKSNDNY